MTSLILIYSEGYLSEITVDSLISHICSSNSITASYRIHGIKTNMKDFFSEIRRKFILDVEQEIEDGRLTCPKCVILLETPNNYSEDKLNELTAFLGKKFSDVDVITIPTSFEKLLWEDAANIYGYLGIDPPCDSAYIEESEFPLKHLLMKKGILLNSDHSSNLQNLMAMLNKPKILSPLCPSILKLCATLGLKCDQCTICAKYKSDSV